MASLANISVRFSTNIREFSTKMQNATREMQKVGRQMQTTGRKVTTGLTLPLIAVGVAVSKLGVEFDDNMTKIQTLVGVSADKVKGFRKEVLQLSGETAKAPAELAKALFTVTSAGLRGAAAMEVLERAAKGSAVGMGETLEIARTTTAIIQAYGKDTINAARATDILTATIREGNLEATELAPVLGRVLGIASKLGISFEEVGASIATFTRLGVDSSEAVVGLRGIMNALIKPSKQAKEALGEINMSFIDLRREVKEKGLAVTLIKLIKSFEGNDEALGKIIPNVRALSAVLGTAGAQSAEYERIVKSLTNSQGVLDEAFEETTKTAGFKLRKAFADLKVVATQFGDVLLPVLADLGKRLSTVLKVFKGLSPETKKTIIQIGAFAAVLGPTIFVVGKLLVSIGAVTKSLKIFSLALATTPFGIAAVAIGVLVTAFAAFNATRNAFKATSISEQLKKEKTELNLLVGAATNENATKESRLRLIKEIQDKYPDFLKNIDAEKISNDDLRKSLFDVNKEYEKKIIQKAAEEDLEQVIRAKVKLQREELTILKDLEAVRQRSASSFKVSGTGASGSQSSAIMSQNRLLVINRRKQEEIKDEIALITSEYAILIPKVEEFNTKVLESTKEGEDALGGKLFDLSALDTSKKAILGVLGTLKELPKAGVESFDVLGKAMIGNVGRLQEWRENLLKTKGVFQELGGSMVSIFQNMVSTGEIGIKAILNLLKQLIAKLIAAAIAAGILALLLPGGGGKAGKALSFGETFKSLFSGKGFANGGSPPVGLASIVGERGPELFIPNTAGTIVPNHQISSTGSGGSQNINVRVTGDIRGKALDIVGQNYTDFKNRITG